MIRDCRYSHVRSIWKAGDLDSFGKIFAIIPKCTVCADMGLNYGRFATKLKKPERFTLGDIQGMSELIGMDFKDLAQLVWLEIEERARIKPLTK